jgi:4-hydroxy-4-methyl-2-oxoglutarate aldolase
MLDPDVFDDLRRYDSATVSNAIEAFNVRPRTEGFMDSTVRCLFPDLPPIVGRAVTCRLENSSESRSKPNLLPDLFDLIWEMNDPAVVVCAHVGPDPERSCLAGDLVSAMLQRLGAFGIVTNVSARDMDVIRRRAPGFQLFARGFVASHGTARVVEVGEEITVAGLSVRPSDILHADLNGVVAVPESIAASVAKAAQDVLDREDAMQRRIHAPEFDYEGLRADFTH